jgi:hypothetical protein
MDADVLFSDLKSYSWVNATWNENLFTGFFGGLGYASGHGVPF